MNSKLTPPDLKITPKEPTISIEEDSIEYVKIHGLQRSGTNWLAFLIKENFENVKVLINEGGWKHGPYMAPWILKREVHVASIIKNPYAWLVSVYNYWGPNKDKNIGPNLQGVEFSDFIRNRYIGEKQRGVPYLIRAKNPVQQWNNMNIHWLSLSLQNKHSCFVTYETLLDNVGNSLNAISKSLNLKPKYDNKWIDNQKEFLPGDKDFKIGKNDFDKEYYSDQKWLNLFTPKLLEFVNNELDLDLMIQFGYKPIMPEDLK